MKRGGPRVSNIPRATRVGNLKKVISAVVPGLQSRFVFTFSDLFSHVGPLRIRWTIHIRDARVRKIRTWFVAEFDLSNIIELHSISIRDENPSVLSGDKCIVVIFCGLYILPHLLNVFVIRSNVRDPIK